MIRLARPDDRERLRELQSQLREPNPPLLDYAIDGPPLVLVSTASRSRDQHQRQEAKRTPVGYLVAFYDDEVDHGNEADHDDEADCDDEPDHDAGAGYVAELAVAPSHRREGRARRLLIATFDRLRDEGCSRVRLAVHPENDPARRLYESLDFEEVGREDDYYADGSDAIILGRSL